MKLHTVVVAVRFQTGANIIPIDGQKGKSYQMPSPFHQRVMAHLQALSTACLAGICAQLTNIRINVLSSTSVQCVLLSRKGMSRSSSGLCAGGLLSSTMRQDAACKFTYRSEQDD